MVLENVLIASFTAIQFSPHHLLKTAFSPLYIFTLKYSVNSQAAIGTENQIKMQIHPKVKMGYFKTTH